MNEEQAKKLVRDVLAHPFDKDNFQQLIVELFDYVPKTRPRVSIPNRFDGKVNDVQLLNEDDSDLIIFNVELVAGVSVERNRSLQRNLIAYYLNTHNKDAALVGFHVADAPEQWRFSFVRRDLSLDTSGDRARVATSYSPVRRFSYLVGADEQTHTAQQQLLSVLTRNDKKSIAIEELQAAFDVEPVSKEFFAQYRRLFDNTHEALKAFLASHPDHKAHFNSHPDHPAEFAKRTLAQIVFLYFLQRKGWLGVARGGDWGSGDRHFMRTRFDTRADDDSYYRSFLQPLFYEALASKRERDFYDRWDVRIPFLNGGLFEPWRGYDWQEKPVDLPDSLFSNDEANGILDIFDRYNFTVQEDDPVEREVAVDPEILGKVFENLIEENRRHASGTYYTPRTVVHYMCQEVLIDYLAEQHPRIKRNDLAILIRDGRNLVEQQRWASADDAPQSESRKGGLPKAVIKAASALDTSLQNVTICDPAVGSGAFPLGMLNEIVHARMALDGHLNNSQTEFAIKLHAINHSLYGVDLDGGAVEIAKLRLWLSLVVDEEDSAKIQPLPNLDYKMMQGNSLISHLDGTPLIDQSLLTSQLDTPRTADGLRLQLVRLQKQAMEIQQSPDAITSESRQNLKDLKAEIRRLENRIARDEAAPERGDDGFDLLTKFDEVARTRQEFLSLQQAFFKCTDTDEKRELREQIDDAHDKLVRVSIQQDESLTADEKTATLAAFDTVKGQYEKPYFLWRLDFNQVFAQTEVNDTETNDTGTGGGFDIVIGNPPYVRHEEIGNAQKGAIRIEMPNAYVGSADLYTYFYFRGLDILRPGGHLTFITSNKFMRARYGASLRKTLAGNSRIREIIDCGDTDVFAAIAYPAMYRIQNAPPSDNSAMRIAEITTTVQLDDIPAHVAATCFDQSQDTIGAEGWVLKPPAIRDLLAKLNDSGQTLGDYIGDRINRGVLTGLNEAFVIDTPTRDALVKADPNSAEIIKPWLRGRDIKRWKTEWAGLWVIFTRRGIDIGHYPAVKAHLQQFREDLEPKKTPKQKRGRKAGNYEWYEIQDTVSYYEAFEKPKIVYPNIATRNEFALDREGYLTNQKAFIIDTDDEALLAYLNSSVVQFWFNHCLPKLQNGFLEPGKAYIENLPIPDGIGESWQKINTLRTHAEAATKALEKNSTADISTNQSQIDHIIQYLYDLTPDEIELIERETGLRDDEEQEQEQDDDPMP